MMAIEFVTQELKIIYLALHIFHIIEIKISNYIILFTHSQNIEIICCDTFE